MFEKVYGSALIVRVVYYMVDEVELLPDCTLDGEEKAIEDVEAPSEEKGAEELAVNDVHRLVFQLPVIEEQ